MEPSLKSKSIVTMRFSLSILLLIGVNLLLNSGCEKVVEESELNFRNDRSYLINSDTPFSGRIVSYYENGQLESSENYTDGERVWVKRYENGQLKYSGSGRYIR